MNTVRQQKMGALLYIWVSIIKVIIVEVCTYIHLKNRRIMEDLIKTFAIHGALLIGKTLIMAPLTARQRLKNKVISMRRNIWFFNLCF